MSTLFRLVSLISASVIAAVAALSFAATSVAQAKDTSAQTVAELQHAEALANSVHEFFRQEALGGQQASGEKGDAYNYRSFKQATESLLRLAPTPIIGDALWSVQLAFVGRQFPKPTTLLEAVEECEKRRDPRLTSLVSDDIRTYLRTAREDIEAERTFGPIVDNPQLYGAITAPTNGIELLRNLGFALDHDVILRRDFYTAENMRRFFGSAPTIYKKSNGSIRTRWDVKPTDKERNKLEPGAERYAQCQYVADLIVTTSAKKKGGIAIVCNFKHALGPTFEEVEQVFGQDWQNTWQMPLHGPPPPRTTPHGNTRITYDFDKAPLRRSITVSFDPNATFSSLNLSEEEY
jgi:hypothetical protein